MNNKKIKKDVIYMRQRVQHLKVLRRPWNNNNNNINNVNNNNNNMNNNMNNNNNNNDNNYMNDNLNNLNNMNDNMVKKEEEEEEGVEGEDFGLYSIDDIDEKEDYDDIEREQDVTFESDEPFYVVNLNKVINAVNLWKKCFPRVRPFYAIKCNPDIKIIETVASMGCGFDCASKEEIQLALDAVGNDDERLIYAHPCKALYDLEFAIKSNVKKMTFDNEDELYKIKKYYPNAQVVLRIAPPDDKSFGAKVKLSEKFGAHIENCLPLLKLAQELELKVLGISFHVGSGCEHPEAYPHAIRVAYDIFEEAKIKLNMKLILLDIGGGYPGHQTNEISLQTIADLTVPVLDELFPPESGVQLIAEPGRLFCEESHTFCVEIIGKIDWMNEQIVYLPPLKKRKESKKKRKSTKHNQKNTRIKSNTKRNNQKNTRIKSNIEQTPRFGYILNEGVYGSFKDCILLNETFIPNVLFSKTNSIKYHSKLFGPSFENFDIINSSCLLPELNVGDWIYFENMGAYTISLASCYAGNKKPNSYYV